MNFNDLGSLMLLLLVSYGEPTGSETGKAIEMDTEEQKPETGTQYPGISTEVVKEIEEWLKCPPEYMKGQGGPGYQDCYIIRDSLHGGSEVIRKYFYTQKGGKKQVRGAFKNGGQDGVITQWYDNGQISVQYERCDNMPCGTVKSWYRGGELASESFFAPDGSRRGVHRVWHSNGRLQVAQTYNDSGTMADCTGYFDELGERVSSEQCRPIARGGVDTAPEIVFDPHWIELYRLCCTRWYTTPMSNPSPQ